MRQDYKYLVNFIFNVHIELLVKNVVLERDQKGRRMHQIEYQFEIKVVAHGMVHKPLLFKGIICQLIRFTLRYWYFWLNLKNTITDEHRQMHMSI